MLKGYTKVEIERKLNIGKEFSKVYKAALNGIMSYESDDVKLNKASLLARYNDLYRKCLDNGNLKGAKDMLDSIAKINGAMTDVSIKTEFTVDWS